MQGSGRKASISQAAAAGTALRLQAARRCWMRRFYHIRKDMDAVQALRGTLMVQAAPTIDGIKPATLFFLGECAWDLPSVWRSHGEQISGELGLCSYVLREDERGLQVLLYRKDRLCCALERPQNVRVLDDLGYPQGTESALAHLAERFKQGCPHEIGLFLGIPWRDVQGFADQKGQNCLLNGYWKVYHRPGAARARFDAFDRSRIAAMRRIVTQRSAAGADLH